MKFEPQCKTKADLHREWARVLDMCEGTEARPEDGWKVHDSRRGHRPTFTELPELYEFSTGIIKGKHLFRGDTYYDVNGIECIATGNVRCPEDAKYWSKCTLHPPKQEPIIPEGFTPWYGGGWTGHPKDIVEIYFRYGEICKYIYPAMVWNWHHGMSKCDIIAYKITKKHEEPKTVMVELPIEDAKILCQWGGMRWYDSLGDACRKALDALK